MAATKQQRVEAELRRLIAAGEAGFTERLPSNRDLAARFDVSTHVIFAVFRSLELAGIVERLPRKGVVVRSGAAAAPTDADRHLRCWICEHYPTQVAFWQAVAEDFRCRHPALDLELHFLAGPAQLDAEALQAGAAILSYGDPSLVTAPRVPLPQLLGAADAAALEADVHGDVWRRGGIGNDLPLWIQLGGLAYRGAPQPPPRPDWTWDECIDWALASWGPGCFPVPPLGMLMETIGLYVHLGGAQSEPWDDEPWLELVRVLAAMADSGVLSFPDQAELDGVDVLSRPGSPLLVSRTFTWPRLGLGRDPAVGVWPMPLHGDGILQTIPIFGCAVGTRATTAQRAWFEHLLDTATQRRFATSGGGLPVLRSVQAQLRDDPRELPPGMAAVLERAVERFGCTPVEGSTAGDPESPVRRILRDLLTPLICGELSRDEVEPPLRERLAELRRRDAHGEAQRRERARRALERFL